MQVLWSHIFYNRTIHLKYYTTDRILCNTSSHILWTSVFKVVKGNCNLFFWPQSSVIRRKHVWNNINTNFFDASNLLRYKQKLFFKLSSMLNPDIIFIHHCSVNLDTISDCVKPSLLGLKTIIIPNPTQPVLSLSFIVKSFYIVQHSIHLTILEFKGTY